MQSLSFLFILLLVDFSFPLKVDHAQLLKTITRWDRHLVEEGVVTMQLLVLFVTSQVADFTSYE